MEYYGGAVCISARELVGENIMTQNVYKNGLRRGKFTVVRRGGGKDTPALIAVDSLPEDYKTKVIELHPNSDELCLRGWITGNFEMDQAAIAFFNDRNADGTSTCPRPKYGNA